MLFKSWTELGLRRQLIVTSVVSLIFLLNSVKNLSLTELYMGLYYASNGYQYYGESGQDTDTKLFWKVLYGNLAFEIPPLWFFRVEWKKMKKKKS